MEQSYLNMFLQGGIIIYILLVISIISLAIIIERLVFIYKQNARYDDFFSMLKSVVKSNDENVKQKVSSKENLSIGKYIAKLKPDSSNPSPNKQIIDDALVEEDSSQKKRLHALIFIVQLAPLLGILGTVLGLAEAFLSIGDLGGTEKFQMLSRGIGMALSTTIAGLVIAAYTMFGHYFIKYRTRKSISALSKHIEDYVQTISAKNEN
ncbi:MAG: MotA/TolQ/ExbB proton channel family protein [Ignavibacteriaceae bacterium]|nr:MotA/TolQ/ExbB proton channel family protein [Ignavibacteriaceae bacterium]MCW8813753.1 MotA/TolQ/ExbB proton channel family protein [Chlorobium sp.]MCW8995499.1 MotA/TolQ/ExbB proton channel family protein [Psychromonas sp.]MCW8816925.1 MotA/TolQ/ExbB proton channel family protein [Ignavibacteriaceae bacterium]MCW8823432.1 MotA/TolQ/ExbB proton channel family protein [Ignavibacteriaceae bacterium]